MILKLDHVKKNYNLFHLNCSLEVEEGCITGFIGQNGAGKSTTFKSILGLITIDDGQIEIFGQDYHTLSPKDKENIGVVLPETGFSGYLTIKDIHTVMKSMYRNFHSDLFLTRCRDFALPMNQKIKDFSTGMKAKLKLIIAVSYDARLLILDEPTAGLDVTAREELLDILREYMEIPGRSVLISSHISSDLESICDDIYMIHNGSIILHEETDVLIDNYALLKASDEQYRTLDKSHILSVHREPYGYSCLTSQKHYYLENYPDLVIEKGSIDDVISMVVKGKHYEGSAYKRFLSD